MNLLIRLILGLIVISIITHSVIADSETEVQQNPPAINTQNIGQLSTEDLINNIAQISANPDLVSRLDGSQIAEIRNQRGIEFLRDNGILDQLDPVQVMDSGIYDDTGEITDFAPEVTNQEESRRTGIPSVSVQGDDVRAADAPGGRRYENVDSLQIGPNARAEGATEAFAGVDPNGQPVFTATGGNVEFTGPLNPQPPNPQPTPITQPAQPTGTTGTPNIQGNPNEAVQAQNGGPLEQGSFRTLVQDDGENANNNLQNQRQITQSSFTNVQGFEARGNTFKVERADSIIFTFNDGRVEISTDVEGFESDQDSFKVRRARQVSVDGISVENIKDAEFSMGRSSLSDAASDILGLSKDASKVVIIKSGPGVFPVTDRSGNEVLFSSIGNSTLAISFDEESPIYVIQNGNLNITPDTPLDEAFTEQINAGNSSAQVIINKALGVLYVKLTPPAAYRYTPESIEKTFALQSTKETHELFMSKQGRQRLKNGCSKCTMVDFVEKLIKVNGILDYKRFFFSAPGKLISTNLETVFSQEKPIYAVLDYDPQLRTIEKLMIRNNTGEFTIRISNWLSLRYEGTKQSQGEVFARLAQVQEPAKELFSEIVNPGNTPVRLVDDPRSDNKVMTQGSVVFYPPKAPGILAYIKHLEDTAQECVLP